MINLNIIHIIQLLYINPFRGAQTIMLTLTTGTWFNDCKNNTEHQQKINRANPGAHFTFSQPKQLITDLASLRIGRDLDNNEIILDNKGISRKHALITFQNGKWWLTDFSRVGMGVTRTISNKNVFMAPRKEKPLSLENGDTLHFADDATITFNIVG